ncbi:MAG: AbrB/MazE/SpoVT family DNA-binding domain-containing protein [Desulfobacteraceae bacterium]|nr:MAG: AbrB/MazE/SpoVT family DNA-binding domain-containing protein [Desulfobacteraceae bacterium]
MLRKLGKSNQVAIPKEIITVLGLKMDDYLDISIDNNRIILEPKVLVPKEQAYFFTKEWQADEEDAEKDIKKGRVTKTKSLDDLFTEMDK